MPWVVIILGYLIGCFPTAYIAGHLRKRGDIRRIGDGNVGAANAFRKLSWRTGIIVGVIDVAKGALVAIIALNTGMSQLLVMTAGLAAVAGHNWPFFLGFRGGRGVSTTIGVLLVMVTLPMLILVLPTILILIVKKNVTPACAFLFITLPLVGWWLKVLFLLIVYGAALPALVGITTYFRTRHKRIQPAN
jgi:glycerol-3-phosphate acyltransferase PlsY